MRTTIEIPDAVFRRAKGTAGLLGMSLKDFVSRAVEHALDSKTLSQGQRGTRVHFPLVKSARPGSVPLSNERVAELLEGEDLHVPSRR